MRIEFGKKYLTTLENNNLRKEHIILFLISILKETPHSSKYYISLNELLDDYTFLNEYSFLDDNSISLGFYQKNKELNLEILEKYKQFYKGEERKCIDIIIKNYNASDRQIAERSLLSKIRRLFDEP